MKSLYAVLVSIFFCGFFSAQINKEADFKETVFEVIKAFSEQDSIQLQKLIDKDIKVFVVHRMGVFDTFYTTSSIHFSQKYPEVLFTFSKEIPTKANIRTGSLPTFSCETEKWIKNGLYVNPNKKDYILSKIAKDTNQYNEGNYTAKDIAYYQDVEKMSRRVVYVTKEQSLVFYLSYSKQKWVLTILDFVTNDCSA